ncbi:MAG: hypothetical protein F4Y02_13075 [Chloroflexi bacterium]|nr:hypothetical protein [Chloroflexota bacterium]
MKWTWSQTGSGEDGNVPGIRRQMIDLIRRRRRKARFTSHRPTEIRPWEVIHPQSGLPFQDAMMWRGISQLLDQGVPLRRVSLRQPRGEEAWECLARLGPDAPLVYIKLQILGSQVLLRSFHEAEYDDD